MKEATTTRREPESSRTNGKFRDHFKLFEAEKQGTEDRYNLVGIKDDGTRILIVEGGKELPPTCAIKVADALNENEDMANMLHVALDLVWSKDGFNLVPAGR